MPKNPHSKDEALEALDFIVNVLKEHEKDLDRMIGKLGNVTEKIGEKKGLNNKMEQIEEKIAGLKKEITNIIGSDLRVSNETPVSIREEQILAPKPKRLFGYPVVFRFIQWEDFKRLASEADTLSFMFKDREKTFQANAHKDNQIFTYTGEIPKLSSLLKIWLSEQLDIEEKNILEGILAIS